MKRIILFLVFIVAIAASCMSADLPPGDHALTVTSTFDGTPQPFRLLVPAASADKDAPLPLLVVLHGKWVNQNAWFDYTPIKKFGEENGYIVVAPHGRGNYFYRGPGERDVLDTIASVRSRFNVDPDRIYLMGHSMGGWGTWWLGLRNRDLFASIAPMAGYAPYGLLPNALHLDPFIIHDADDPIVSVQNSRVPVAELPGLGLSHRYLETTGYGHASRLIGDNLPALFKWMDDHRRPESPARVTVVTRTPAAGSAWWLRLMKTTKYPDLARVDAVFQKDKGLIITTGNTGEIALNLSAMPEKNLKSLSITIDENEIAVDCAQPWAFLKRDEKGVWTHTLRANPPAPWFSSLISTIPVKSAEATSATLLTEAASRLLCEETGADLCLMIHDMFQFPGGPLTEDGILDLYVYPEERCALVEYSGQPFPEHITLKSELFPRDRAADFAGKKCRVLAPLSLARILDPGCEPLPDFIGGYLLKAARRHKGFPLSGKVGP
ncbi:MAG TPA: alpha/beta hydrolase-fold protein [Candidatus Sumerlaeota bacterium]|nr:alpha/beta hydrolase-fold protein [Candidatus Sumerlaeota bacterium]